MPASAQAPQPTAVIETYVAIARAMYEDAAAGTRELAKRVDALLADPSDATLGAAREAWRQARVPYQQTEGLRFGNKSVDELEGKVNAWPLDEGLIDYVDTSIYGESSDDNPLFRANVIANKRIRVGRNQIDAGKIDKKLLERLHEAGGVEANVATGYHAIEFLLWGQDLNGTGPGAGNRPATDYSLKACTGGNCDRRRDYLKAATALLVEDVDAMAKLWAPGGKAVTDLARSGESGALAVILTGIGSLSYGELAGERMKLGLILHDPEEEHDCFSDNTHNSHWYNQVGMVDIVRGRYVRPDGKVVEGPSIMQLAEANAPEEARRLEAAMNAASEKLGAIKARADSGTEAYDQMIAEGNAEGNRIVQEAIDALIAQTRAVEAVVAKLGLKISVGGSDSLDDPGKVGKKG
ncbi:imelysin family protein [Enterovirga aerilata]|uniref:Peptidase n=1 Tax=Enterovirga aerilata TaxID=2730920 RepID=A0A849IAX1_9HYPH|nr:imelysin family protein [Enterovirga sp. DB1703]NNM73405.1 peptidase [Enterovirga sp. DB1703]